jgi:hypothetical protein
MMRAFELDWLGGPAERHFRRRRPGVDSMPWGSLEPKRYPRTLLERARASWTEGAVSEFASAAAFAQILEALLALAAPVDLIGMAGEFVADEMLHVELNSRVAMELGGGVPVDVDFEAFVRAPARTLSPFERANELVVRTSCVGEALSVPLLVGSMRSAAHPLTRAVLERIAKDEAPHARFGWIYLEWAVDRMDDAERARVARIAEKALGDYVPLWQQISSSVRKGTTSEGFDIRHVHELGWMEAQAYGDAVREAVRDDVMAPLAALGIRLSKDRVDRLFSMTRARPSQEGMR